VLREADACASFEHCKQHGEAAWVEALRAAPGWNVAGNLVRECLHLDEEWALAFKCWNHHGAWRTGATVGQKHLACIGYANQTKFGHFE
jgi:hypothetical protein